MARDNVMKSKDFAEDSAPELKEKLKDKGLKQSGSREEQVQRLVEHSYPVYRFPKVRKSSVRGVILGTYVGEKGVPNKEAVSDDEVLAKVRETGTEMSDERIKKDIAMYQYNLVRYYGYSLVQNGDKKRFVKR